MRPKTALPLLALLTALAAPMHAAGQPVDLEAPDGLRLKASYWAAESPGPGILLLHMCNSDRSAWAGLDEKLAAAGFHVLALDYRSYGESGGEAPEGVRERQAWIDEKWPGDVDTAFESLAASAGVDRTRVGAAGGSCGVNQAIQLARRHPEVRTLVLLAGSTNRVGERFLEENPWMPLFGSAAHDDGNAVEMMEWTLGLSGNPENVLRPYSHGGHGTEMFAVHADLEPAIVAWFEEHLARRPAARPAAGDPPVVTHRTPSAAIYFEMHEPGGAARVRARFTAAREKSESIPLPPEVAINLLGYELLGEGRTEDAIEALRLNVDVHPDSANTYDSLGDAYLEAGWSELAAEMARRTLEALPGDPNQNQDFQRALREAAERKLGPPAEPKLESRSGTPAPQGTAADHLEVSPDSKPS